jgi:ankyrin repeat protein
MPPLLELVEGRRWRQVIDRVRRHPEEARLRNWPSADEGGTTALHEAAMNDAPIDVIDALLQAYPDATMALDNDGWTPLHTSCYFDASHEIVERLLQANLMAVYKYDNEGRLPLHLIHEVISYRWGSEVREVLHSENITDIEKILNDEDLLRVRLKFKLLVKAAYHGSIENPLPGGKVWRPLHACAGVDRCPVSFMELATKGNAHLLKEPDEDGNLPLHIAASNRNFTDDKRERFNSVAYLVSEYPEAAAVKNDKGDLPLHLAVRSGKYWEKGVESIYRAYPGAVLERDSVFGLYVFKVAAIVGEGSMESLTTCYHLLKAFPELERFENYFIKRRPQGQSLDKNGENDKSSQISRQGIVEDHVLGHEPMEQEDLGYAYSSNQQLDTILTQNKLYISGSTEANAESERENAAISSGLDSMSFTSIS